MGQGPPATNAHESLYKASLMTASFNSRTLTWADVRQMCAVQKVNGIQLQSRDTQSTYTTSHWRLSALRYCHE